MKKKPDMNRLNAVVESTIHHIERGNSAIYELTDERLNELIELRTRFIGLNEELGTLLAERSELEQKHSVCVQKLNSLKGKFAYFTEEHISETYETTNKVSERLAVINDRIQNLFEERQQLEREIDRIKDFLNTSESIFSKVSGALKFLSVDFNEELEDINDKKHIAMSLMQAQEHERRRLAREIHDGPAQSIANLILKTEYCSRLLDIDQNRAKDELEDLKKETKEALASLRKVIYDLMPMSLSDLGVVSTIKQMALNFEKKNRIPVTLNLEGAKLSVSSDVELAIFRLFQESLNNIVKHAMATQVVITLIANETEIIGVIKDNGRGFDPTKVKRDKHHGFGLESMKERAFLLDGHTEIKSSNTGTEVKFVIPVVVKGE